MPYPVVAVIGRPNVGKSTLVNRLAGKQTAVIDELSGVTRDRNYLNTDWNGRYFTLIDTGGLDYSGEPFTKEIREQVNFALEEADLIILLVDGSQGLTAMDSEVADLIRHTNKKVLLVVNKVDKPDDNIAILDFYQLGMGEPRPVSAIHGTNTGDLLDDIVAALPEHDDTDEEDEAIAVAIIGRPNAGKSTLFNRLVQQERSIVTDIPGTTRDAINTRINVDGTEYLFIDTAGMRKKSRVERGVEYYTNIRTIRSIDKADLVLLVIDSIEGITDQDQRLARLATDRGCAIIVLLNKWDAVEKDENTILEYELELERKLDFIRYAPYLTISGLSGQRVTKIFDNILYVAEQFERRVSTNELLSFAKRIATQGHALTKGRYTLRMSYAVQARTKPPEFVFFVNHPQIINVSYKRYLENRLREEFGFLGTPLKLYFRKKT